jgi:glycosyltransferase involved in cell wall biosynthesis
VTQPEPPPPPRPVRVGWFFPVVAHYRVPVINRLADRPGIDLTVFAGQALPGVSNSDASGEVTARVVRVWSMRGFRVGIPFNYAVGWTRMLATRQRVILTTESTAHLVNWLLLAVRPWFRFRFVVVGHIRLTPHDRPRVAWLRRRLVAASDGVVAYTDEGARQALAWGVAPSQVVAMGNTIDVERVARARANLTEARVAALRAELGLGDGPVYLFIARPTAVKRLDVAIETVRLLAARGVAAHLLVVGSGAALPTYEAQARDLGSVRFLGEVHDEDALAPLFAVSDLVFIPGAVGLAVNHAFAYGLPLVTAEGAHGPEMVIAEDGRNAVIVDACEPERFATELEALARSPERLRARRAGAAGTEVASIETMAERIASLVERLTAPPPAAA